MRRNPKIYISKGETKMEENRTFDEFEAMDSVEDTDEETLENSGKKKGVFGKVLIGAGILTGVGVGAYLIKNRKKIKENRERRRIEELRAKGYYIREPGVYEACEDVDTETEESFEE
jgi:hypothetical protein